MPPNTRRSRLLLTPTRVESGLGMYVQGESASVREEGVWGTPRIINNKVVKELITQSVHTRRLQRLRTRTSR